MVALLQMPSRLRITPADDERRLFVRKEDHRQIHAHRLDHRIDARRNPNLSLDMRDISVGGVGAISDQPVNLGERLNLFFAGDQINTPWTMRGQIVRCQPSAMGYRLGIAFDVNPTAA